jgi:tagatose-1,6-bisphosphate aldolase
MSSGTKRLFIGAVAGIGAGYAVKKTRVAVSDSLSPFASALLLAVVGVVAQQVISTALSRVAGLES